MSEPAPLAVTVELRLLDTGTRRGGSSGSAGRGGEAPPMERVFREAAEISERGLTVARTIPYEPGRRVACSFALPGDERPLTLTAIIDAPPRARGQEPPPADSVTFKELTDDARTRIEKYTRERNALP